MVRLKSQRLRRMISILLTITMMVTLLPGRISTANAEATPAFEDVISNICQKLNEMEGVGATSENGWMNVEIADKRNQDGFVKKIIEVIISEETGARNLLEGIMSAEEGTDNSIKIKNAGEFDFGEMKENGAKAFVSAIALISDCGTAEDFLNVVKAEETGIVVTLNRNITLLDQLLYIEKDGSEISVSERWNELLGDKYTDVASEKRGEAAVTLLYDIIDSGRVKNGSEVSVRYEGQEITVSIKIKSTVTVKNGYDDSADTEITVDNGTTIADCNIEEPTRTGYTFKQWSVGGKLVESNYVIDGDVTLTAEWSANVDTPYMVLVYEMDVQGNYPDEAKDTIHKTGTTDSKIEQTDIAQDREGFAFDENKSDLGKTVLGDGTTKVKAYYKRNQWTVTYDAGTTEAFWQETAYYNANLTAPAEEPSREGFVFEGWFIGEEKVDFDSYAMPDDDITIQARWIAESDLYEITAVDGSELSCVIKDDAILLYNKPIVIRPNTEGGIEKIIEDGAEVDEVKKTNDGSYDFSLRFMLKTGKTTAPYNFKFTIDQTPPTIECDTDSVSYGEKTNITFKNITDPITGTSASGIQSVEIRLGGENGDIYASGTDTSYTVEWKDLPETIGAESEYKVVAIAKDFAGNIAKKEVSVKKDTVAPAFELSEIPDRWFNGENTDNQVDVSISEINDGEKGSGIAKVEIQYGGTTISHPQNGEAIKDSYTVSWEDLPEGECTVDVTVTDNAGNMEKKQVLVKKDTIVPAFELSEIPEGWLRADDRVDVNISGINDGEKGSGIAKVEIQYGDTTISYPQNGEEMKDSHTVSWENLPEGEYDVNVTVTDNAGKSFSKSVSIKKDTINPTFELSEIPEKWLKADNGVDINISEISDGEKGSGISSVILSYVEKDDEGEDIPESEIIIGDYSEDIQEAYEIKWDALPEGDYYVKAVIRDNAGNETFNVVHIQKDIQNPAPELTKSADITPWTTNVKVEDGETNPSVVFSKIKDAAIVTDNDVEADTAIKSVGTEVSGIDIDGDGVVLECVSGTERKSIKIMSPDGAEGANPDDVCAVMSTDESGAMTYTIPWDKLPEGDYFVEITVADDAGNVTTDKVHVQKDITIPQISPSEDITPWTNMGDNVVFSNIGDIIGENHMGDAVSGIQSVQLSYVEKDTDGVQTKETEVPSEDAKKSENGDTYTINWGALPQGDYFVRAVITDEAGNVNTKEVRVQKDTALAFEKSADITPWTTNAEKSEDNPSVIFSKITDENSKIANVTLSYVEKDADGQYIPESEIIIGDYSEDVQETYEIKWDALPEGDYYVKAVIRDNAGNETFNEVHVQKDIQNPAPKLTKSADITPWMTNTDEEGDEVNPSVVFSKIKDAAIVTDNDAETGTDIKFVGTEVSGIDFDGDGIVLECVSGTERKTVKIVSPDEAEGVNPDDVYAVMSTDESGAMTYTIPWDKLPEGDYFVEITITDQAGNVTSDQIYVQKDITAPKVEVLEDSGDITPWTTNAEKSEDNPSVVFSNVGDTEMGSNHIGDETSGIKSLAMNFVYKDSEEEHRQEVENYNVESVEDGINTYTISWENLPEGNYYVEMKVIDNAGNENTDQVHIQKDITDPVCTPSDSVTQWTNNGSDVTFSGIKDGVIGANAVGEETSGIASVELEYVTGNIREPVTTAKKTTEDNGDTYTILWTDLPEGNYDVLAMVTDNAGNNITSRVHVQKDIQNPQFTKSEDITPWTTNAQKSEDNPSVVFSGIKDAAIGETHIGTEVSGIDGVVLAYVSGEEKRLVTVATEGVNPDDVEAVVSTDKNGSMTYEIPWDKLPEGDYFVEITVTDKAGNVTSDKVYVQKDITAPVFTASSPITPWTTNAQKNGDNPSVVFSNVGDTDMGSNHIGDATSGIKSVAMNFIYEDKDGEHRKKVENYDVESVEDGINTYTISWENLPEGDYSVEMKVIDNAGNENTDKVRVKKDITASELTVKVEGNIAKKAWSRLWDNVFIKNIKFLNFSSTKVEVTLNYNDPKPSDKNAVNDQRSGIASVQYFVTDKSIVQKTDLEQYKNWSVAYKNDEMDKEHKASYNFAINTDTNVNAVVYVKVTDVAGNVTYGSSDGIIVDKRNPKPEIKIDIPKAENGFYNTSVPVTYSVTDPVNGGSYSGLKTVTYEIINGDNAGNNVTKTINYQPEAHIQTTNAQKVTINGNKFNSNNVVFRVTAVDNAGNSTSKEVKLKIDTTSPKMEVSYAPAAHQNEYYRENRVATITVTERNFMANNVNIVITKNGSEYRRLANVTWTKVAGTGNRDNTKHIATITYSDDGDYTFRMDCTDKAGNKNSKPVYNGGNEKKFTVDKTLPIVTVTYDNTPTNNKYYKSDVKATVVIKEHNFDAADVKLTTTGASAVGSFSKTGNDEYTAVISYMDENECQFDIEYGDKAGNAAKYNDQSGNNKNDYAMDEFVVDKTAPKDIVFTTEPNSANKGTATATFDFQENYFSDSTNSLSSRNNAINISIKGYKNGDVTSYFPFSLTSNGSKVEVKFGDFPREIQWDDVYTITTTVTDLAGNETSGDIVFSVNRFGSNYVLGTSTEALVDKYYTNTQQEIEVYEISASTKYVEDYSISTIINGERKELTEENDFRVDHNWKVEYPDDYDVNGKDNVINITGDMLKEIGASANNGWKINHYTVNADNFDTEGEYTVLISSTDTAGNSMASNTSKYESSKNVGFVYDKSLPEWYIKNAEESDVYKGASYDFEIAVSDDVSSVEKVEITYNDKTTVYAAKDIADGIVTFTAEESLSAQQLKIVVTDKAGNITKEDGQIYTFRLTSNALLQFFYLYWVYLLMAFAVMTAGIIIVVILKKRKKEETEQK